MSIKTIKIAAGIKRIINTATGRDVLIASDADGWTMMANSGQPDGGAVLGVFATVKAAREAVAAAS